MVDINETENLTLEEIFRYSIEERANSRFNASLKGDIGKVVIDGNEFTNYKAFSFIWEKSYIKEPSRSSNGSIGNLNSYPTFVTPHLKIDFSLISIDDYRKLYNLILSRNEFTVTCYDIVNNSSTTNKMYFAPDQMPTLYAVARQLSTGQSFVELAGIKDYTVELIGTNNELDLVSIIYLPNYPQGQNPSPSQEGEEDIYIGEEFIVGSSSTFPANPPNGYVFKNWVDQDGRIYQDGIIITATKTLTLTAQWSASSKRTLSFDYGEAKVVDDKMSMEVQVDTSIGSLPTPNDVVVKYGEFDYTPYNNGGWYKLPVKDEQYRVYSGDKYWINRNTTIYWLLDKIQYTIKFVTNSTVNTLPNVYYGYQDKVALPTLLENGKTFLGWFRDSGFEEPFMNGSGMPPFSITLYAKWG